MSIRLKLKMLSRKMKLLGNMHPDYKGLGMYSEMSPNMLKSTFLYFIKFFLQELSIIFIDTKKEKITWYNKPLYLQNKKAIVCIDCQHSVCLLDNVLLYSNVLKEDTRHLILDYLNRFNILDDYDTKITCDERGHYTLHNSRRPKDQSVFIALLNYQLFGIPTEDQSNAAEVLRHKLGEHIHNYLLLYNKTPADIASELDAYLNEKYEKLTYIIC